VVIVPSASNSEITLLVVPKSTPIAVMGLEGVRRERRWHGPRIIGQDEIEHDEPDFSGRASRMRGISRQAPRRVDREAAPGNAYAAS
jgi:hypothetical protein